MTKNVCPREDNEGYIGIAAKRWAKGYFHALAIGSFNGVLKASNGDVAGSSTQDDLPDGTTYKQYNPADVAITGGNISGITDLAVADGGTGASSAAGAKANLGFMTDLVDDTSPQLGGDLDTNGHAINSLKVNRTGVAADYTTSGETIIGVTDTSAARTITLASSDCSESRTIIIKDESGGAGTNNITVATEGSETIDGASTQVISTNYGTLRVYSDGSNWFIW